MTTIPPDVEDLWQCLLLDGMHPTRAIEQISALVVLKRLEELDAQGAPGGSCGALPSIYAFEGGQDCRWSSLLRRAHADSDACLALLRGPVFAWLRSLSDYQAYLGQAHFDLSKAHLLARLLGGVDRVFSSEREPEALGANYEALLALVEEATASSAGKSGRFYTPEHIARLLCALVRPQAGETICDPACGTGRLLVAAYRSLGGAGDDERFARLAYGFDIDPAQALQSWVWLNLLLAFRAPPQIRCIDALGSAFGATLSAAGGPVGGFDVLASNPPFSGLVDEADIGVGLRPFGTNKTELLFAELVLQLVREGGRAALILPSGVLFGSTRAHRALRRRLVEENQLHAIIDLPSGAFLPATNVKTALLLLTRGGRTRQTWYYEVTGDGYSFNTRRVPQPDQDDFWDLQLKYALRSAAPPPAFVDAPTWARWGEMDPLARSHSYARPLIAPQQVEGGTRDVFCGLETVVLASPRDWVVTAEELAAQDYQLLPGRYKPPVAPPDVTYEDPRVLIRQAMAIELDIQRGLAELLSMLGENGSDVPFPVGQEEGRGSAPGSAHPGEDITHPGKGRRRRPGAPRAAQLSLLPDPQGESGAGG